MAFSIENPRPNLTNILIKHCYEAQGISINRIEPHLFDHDS